MRRIFERFFIVFVLILMVTMAVFVTSCSLLSLISIVSESVSFLVDPGWPTADLIAWSPIGNTLAITSTSFSRYFAKIYLFDINSKELSLLLETEEFNGIIISKTWSPDGSRIAFVGNGGVYLIDLTTVFGEDFLTEGLPCP